MNYQESHIVTPGPYRATKLVRNIELTTVGQLV
uniref:Uncharacterized protein n=1 Tax=Anguilla anguilla TaxID=7936 RepID=A0A0E9RXV0_ANGAN